MGVFFISGGRAGTRTLDPLIKSQLLYQLSYAPMGLQTTNKTWQLYIFFAGLQGVSYFFKYCDGLYALVPLRTSKCNCGVSTLPVAPTVPIFCPTFTRAPRRTANESICA